MFLFTIHIIWQIVWLVLETCLIYIYIAKMSFWLIKVRLNLNLVIFIIYRHILVLNTLMIDVFEITYIMIIDFGGKVLLIYHLISICIAAIFIIIVYIILLPILTNLIVVEILLKDGLLLIRILKLHITAHLKLLLLLHLLSLHAIQLLLVLLHWLLLVQLLILIIQNLLLILLI